MNNFTINILAESMKKIQEAIKLLEKIEGNNKQVDAVLEDLRFSFADLEFELN